jgi:hypothetical protein
MRAWIEWSILLLLLQPAAAAEIVLSKLPVSAVEFQAAAPELSRSEGMLTVALPGRRAIAIRTESGTLEPGMVGLRGWSVGSDRVNLFIAGDFIQGDIYATGGRYRLVRHAGRHYWVPVAELPEERAFVEPPPVPVQRSPERLPAAKRAPVAAPDSKGIYEIDLLVMYTQRFKPPHGNVRAEAQRYVFLANTYFANSSVPVRYRIVGIESLPLETPIQGPEELAPNPHVKEARDRLGADLVFLLEGDDCLGISSLFNGNVRTEPDEPPGDVNAERDAFSFAAMSAGCPDYVPPHELGHSMGGGHDTAFSYGINYWKGYAHGWDCGDAGLNHKYASVMHYGHFGIEARGDFFSNPDLILDGEPCGSELPVEPVWANNAHSITQAAPYVAAYRNTARAGKSDELSGGGLNLGLLLPLLAGLFARCGTMAKRRRV